MLKPVCSKIHLIFLLHDGKVVTTAENTIWKKQILMNILKCTHAYYTIRLTHCMSKNKWKPWKPFGSTVPEPFHVLYPHMLLIVSVPQFTLLILTANTAFKWNDPQLPSGVSYFAFLGLFSILFFISNLAFSTGSCTRLTYANKTNPLVLFWVWLWQILQWFGCICVIQRNTGTGENERYFSTGIWSYCHKSCQLEFSFKRASLQHF